MARRRKNTEIPVEEANILPVMNIMFLLIPALLLAMEVATMASIPTSPPKMSASAEQKEEKKEEEKSLELKVWIKNEVGFEYSYQGQKDAEPIKIPLKKADLRYTPENRLEYFKERWDFATLEDTAKKLKESNPNEINVQITAENDVHMQILINTMDALRGSDCRLADLKDAELPKTCYFTGAIINPGM